LGGTVEYHGKRSAVLSA